MIYGNYVYTKKINLNLDDLKKSSLTMYDIVCDKFGDGRIDYDGQSTMSTKLFSNYNLLMYALPGFNELYHEIKSFFHDMLPHTNTDKFYIQCWLNVYKKGDFIDWHAHWPPEQNSWHGFYCVDCGTHSGTIYRLPVTKQEVFVPSENNLLVLSKSDGDLHKSTEWFDDLNPRITIAFDIVPRQFIVPTQWLNHWIPI